MNSKSYDVNAHNAATMPLCLCVCVPVHCTEKQQENNICWKMVCSPLFVDFVHVYRCLVAVY